MCIRAQRDNLFFLCRYLQYSTIQYWKPTCVYDYLTDYGVFHILILTGLINGVRRQRNVNVWK